MSSLIEDIKRRQHDFKNHLNTIYGITQVAADDEVKVRLKEYIESLRNSILDSDNIVHVKNKIIAAIIYNKVCEAKDKNINFKYEVDSEAEIGLKQHELSEVLNNLLDNAFDAAIKAESMDKNVELKVYREDINKVIEARNSISIKNIKNISKFFIKGFSTKEEKGHGYGLHNVKKIVEANKGQIQLSIEENIIIFKLVFR
jgi:sensor histidine kinase regulating citrate/malate metabolism